MFAILEVPLHPMSQVFQLLFLHSIRVCMQRQQSMSASPGQKLRQACVHTFVAFHSQVIGCYSNIGLGLGLATLSLLFSFKQLMSRTLSPLAQHLPAKIPFCLQVLQQLTGHYIRLPELFTVCTARHS